MTAELSVFAVGDVFIDRAAPTGAFHAAGDALADGDIVFGNCEGVFSDAWERAPSSGSPVVTRAANARALAGGRFTVMSLANNHSVDGGHAALLGTRKALLDRGIQPVGAGENIVEARTPVVVDGPPRVAFLAYAAVFPHGYEARPGVPGLAPIRAHTHYSPWELNEWNPGLLPKVTTTAFPEDVRALRRDIGAARERADVVVTSFHWGDFTRPFVLTDHERRTARLAIDSGADAVVGHHHHMLRGVEFYRGKPIFYGLGHFLFDLPGLPERQARDGYLTAAAPEDELALTRRFGEYRIRPREDYPLLPFHPDSRMTGIAVIRVREGAAADNVVSAGFRPAVIDRANEPIPFAADSPQGQRVVEYLRRCCAEELLRTELVRPQPDSGLPDDAIQFVSHA
ncbi:CapA family protein [Nocardia terpenica]|uniref:CapA family protein n=1 Tax=Nocardia terpenica TaxID=455432 RepID=UPI002B4B62A3|nr:CapA family protein [Nocardia terpenica]